MNKDWKTYKLSDFCSKVTDGTHDSPKRQSQGKSLITSKHIKERNIDFESAYLISIEDFNKINFRSKVEQWDVLISMIGEYCGFCYIERNKDIDYAVKNVGIFKAGSKIKAEWIYYYLNSPNGRGTLASVKSGTSQPYISLSALRDLQILVPDSENRMLGITSILSSLDDKIELNLQMNQTLEAMAQAIFKEWFVNFNFPGFDGNMKNGLPKGWRKMPMGDVVNVKGGTTPSTIVSEYWDGEHFWSTPKDLSNIKSPVLLDTERKITEQGVKQIGSGIMPKGTLLLSSRAPIGYVAISNVPISINQGYIAIQGKLVSNVFMLFWLKGNMESIKGRGNGSTFQEISKTSFKGIEVVVPDKNVLTQFDEIANPIFGKIVANEIENRTLTQLRDILLPKLMSGKITVN